MTLSIIDMLSWGFLVIGAIFCAIGGLGLLRFPDFYSRLHGAGITDTLGAGLVLTGLMLQGGVSMVTVKLVIILACLWLTSPTSTHALAKAARSSGLEPLTGDGGQGRG
ncbi:MAG: monovalent cation/H(+) antiporter subunit G [Candidatus Latescibacterota bacterium]|jgi:multicomponent Na+:H+ antiporter subunit G